MAGLPRVTRWTIAIGEARLSQSAKLVGWALATWMDLHSLECWPRVSEIARRASSTKRTVRGALIELLDAGLLEWKGDGRGGRSKTYRFTGLIPSETGAVEHPFEEEERGSVEHPFDDVKGVRGAPVSTDERGSPEPERGSPQHVKGVRGAPRTKERTKEEPLAASPRERRAEIFEAIASACGIDLDDLTPSARGRLNRAAKELDTPRVSPEEITARAKRYRVRFPTAELTASALCAHWPSLAGKVDTGDDKRAVVVEAVHELFPDDDAETLVDRVDARAPISGCTIEDLIEMAWKIGTRELGLAGDAAAFEAWRDRRTA